MSAEDESSGEDTTEEELNEYVAAKLDTAMDEWFKLFLIKYITGEGTGEPLGILGTLNQEKS